MGADCGEAAVEVDEPLPARCRLEHGALPERSDVGGDEVLALRVEWPVQPAQRRRVSTVHVLAEVAPLVVTAGAAVEASSKAWSPIRSRIVGQLGGDDRVAEEHRRQRRAGVQCLHGLDVAAEDLLLHRLGVEEVDRDEEELLAVELGAPLGRRRRGVRAWRGRGCRG